MLRAGVDAARLAEMISINEKTVGRWIAGRIPHRRNRLAVAAALGESEATIWPSARPDQHAGSPATAEVVGAYAHRADVPQDLWVSLLTSARNRIDLLGYAYPFLLEITPRAVAELAARCRQGVRLRMAFADPECAHVLERDGLEQLGGTLPGRIRNALAFLGDLPDTPASVGLHSVHLYNSIFRFDDQMIVTPHLYRARGYQHPALHLRKLSPYGIFESYAIQFEQIWDTVSPFRPVAPSPEVGAGPAGE